MKKNQIEIKRGPGRPRKPTFPNKNKSWTKEEHEQIASMSKKLYAFGKEEKHLLALAKKLGRTPLSVRTKVHTFRTMFWALKK
jgi:hypothetical protein